MQIVDRLTPEDLRRWRDVAHSAEAVRCSPAELTFKQMRSNLEQETAFLAEIHERYELDGSERITISVVTGDILYGES